jgi:hypothetical protein
MIEFLNLPFFKNPQRSAEKEKIDPRMSANERE